MWRRLCPRLSDTGSLAELPQGLNMAVARGDRSRDELGELTSLYHRRVILEQQLGSRTNPNRRAEGMNGRRYLGGAGQRSRRVPQVRLLQEQANNLLALSPHPPHHPASSVNFPTRRGPRLTVCPAWLNVLIIFSDTVCHGIEGRQQPRTPFGSSTLSFCHEPRFLHVEEARCHMGFWVSESEGHSRRTVVGGALQGA